MSSRVAVITGSLLDSDATYLVHQCNCVTNKGLELAAAMFTRFPEANIYAMRNGNIHSDPGTIDVRGRVVNLFGQYKPGGPTGSETREMRERWFSNGLMRLRMIIKEGDTIAFPYGIGCGLAKGVWRHYLSMIEQFAVSLPEGCRVQIFILPSIAGSIVMGTAHLVGESMSSSR